MSNDNVTRFSLFPEDEKDIEYNLVVVLDDHLKINIGDIFQLGDHRLMCGDATNPEHVKLLAGNIAPDLWITDPPYNVAYEGGTEDKLTIINDEMNDEEFGKFVSDSYRPVADILKPGGAYYIFHADSEGYNFRKGLRDVGLQLRQTLIWKKNSLVLGRQDYHWIHEPILYGWKDGAAHNWYSDRSQVTVLEFDKPQINSIHPTMKLIDLLMYLIKNSSAEGDWVIDTFAGSGSTLIAAEYTKRKSLNLELDPNYVNAIITRFERMTGKKHVKIREGS